MNGLPETTTSALPDPRQLRAMVMSIIHDRQDYDDLLTYLEPIARSGQRLPMEASMELALLLSDVDRFAELNDQLYGLVKHETAPTLVLTEAGVILAQNEGAAELFHSMEGDNHTRLGISAEEFEAFQRRIFAHRGPTLLPTKTADSETALILTATYHAPHRVFLLQSLECRWPESVDYALQELFGLTPSERDILASLAQGLSAEEISEQRVRALGTVRQQIKSLMQKLNTNRQNQVVSLGAAIANRTAGQLPQHTQPGLISPYPLELGEFIRDHRLVGWRRYGDPQGFPVLLLHGPFFGAGEFEHSRELAHQHGMNVMIPERPGYGRTQPANRDTDPLDNQVQDCLQLLDDQGIEQAYLLAHESGLIPALALAVRYPQRFAGLLVVSPSGHFSFRLSLEGIPRQQRLLLWAARNAHWMLRMMIRLMMVQVRQLGPERWVEAAFVDAPHELEVLYADSSRQGTLSTYSFNYSQNGAGIELDVQQTTTDWHELVKQITIPFEGIMGGRNGTTPPEFARTLCDLNPALRLHEIPEAGQTLSISHADEIFRLLAERIATLPRRSDDGF